MIHSGQDFYVTKIISIIDYLIRLIIVTSMALILVVTCVQIFFRFVLHNALPWPEEAARFLMVWSLFLAAVYVQNERGHIGVNFFVARLSYKAEWAVRILINSLIIVFLLVMIKGGIEEAQTLMSLKTGALRIPRGIPYLVIPLTGILMIIVNLRLIAEDISKIREK
jgi:TRAP-type transport system small permease protein